MTKVEEIEVPVSIEGLHLIGLHDSNLSQWVDMPTSLGVRTPPRGVTILSINTSKECTHHGTSFECHIIDASGLKTYSAPKVDVRLEINKLMKMISS